MHYVCETCKQEYNTLLEAEECAVLDGVEEEAFAE